MINDLIMERAPDFDLLGVLVAVSEERNFREAARRLGMSQGAVSLKLKALQETLPLPLFSLVGKRKVLTHYGRELSAFARSEMDRWRLEYGKVNRKYEDAARLSLVLGCRREVFEQLASRFMFGGTVVHRAHSAHEAALALQSRQIDLAITHERPDSAELMAKKMLVSTAVLAVHKRWVKGALQPRSKEFLLQTPCILYQTDGHLLRDWVESLGLNVKDLQPRIVTDDWRTLQTLVQGGYGYAVLPNYIALPDREVLTAPLPESVLHPVTFYAVYRRDLAQIPAFKKMMAGW
jgi:DNA-binding transcriptional LysR family regulator